MKATYTLLAISAIHAAVAGKNHHANEKDVSTRIVGGLAVAEGVYPFMVQYGGEWICGGSVIDAHWVLTAAHCECMDKVRVGSISWGSGVELEVTACIPHPDYESDTEDKDFQLLYIAEGIDLAKYPAVQLASDDALYSSGTIMTVAGWGVTKSEATVASKILRQAQVAVVAQNTCQSQYSSQETSITENMFCAAMAGKDSCQGDSGGPIFFVKADKTVVQTGIVSFGIGCADPKYPGVYSRLSSQRNWILETIARIPFPDQDLGVLGADTIVFIEGSTAGRTNSYGNPGPDVRVSFTLPNFKGSGTLDISLCSPSTDDMDTKIWLLDSSNNMLLTSNDDSDGCSLRPFSSSLSLSVGPVSILGAGKKYTIVVDGYKISDFGNFGLTLTTDVKTPSVCEALYVVAAELGIENLCDNLLDLDKEYQCKVSETEAPTTAPTKAPTNAPTNAPTKRPTKAPTKRPTKAPSQIPVAVVVWFKIPNVARYTTIAPLFMSLVGDGGESGAINLGNVVANKYYKVSGLKTGPTFGTLQSLKFCLSSSDNQDTTLARKDFFLWVNGAKYVFALGTTNLPLLMPGQCHTESVMKIV